MGSAVMARSAPAGWQCTFVLVDGVDGDLDQSLSPGPDLRACGSQTICAWPVSCSVLPAPVHEKQPCAGVDSRYRSLRALLGAFEDFGECDHDASGGVLEGCSHKGARLCGGGAGRRIVGKVQVQQSIRRRRAAVFRRPDLGHLQPGEDSQGTSPSVLPFPVGVRCAVRRSGRNAASHLSRAGTPRRRHRPAPRHRPSSHAHRGERRLYVGGGIQPCVQAPLRHATGTLATRHTSETFVREPRGARAPS